MDTNVLEEDVFKSFNGFKVFAEKKKIILSIGARKVLSEIEYDGKPSGSETIARPNAYELQLPEEDPISIYGAIKATKSFDLKLLKSIEAVRVISDNKDALEDGDTIIAMMYPIMIGEEKYSLIGEKHGEYLHIKLKRNNLEFLAKNIYFASRRK
jgi:hypothetical protein